MRRPTTTLRRQVASKMAGVGHVPPPPKYTAQQYSTSWGGHGLPSGRPQGQILPGSFVPPTPGSPGATPGGPGAAAGNVAPKDPAKPDPKDSIYLGAIGEIKNTRENAKRTLAENYTTNTAGATTSGNKAGLLHSSALANKLADLKSGYGNDLNDIKVRYGEGEDYGTAGLTALGEGQQRHLGDPSPTVVDNATLGSLNAPANAASPNSTVQLANGWRILYDAGGKPVRFLKPGEEF